MAMIPVTHGHDQLPRITLPTTTAVWRQEGCRITDEIVSQYCQLSDDAEILHVFSIICVWVFIVLLIGKFWLVVEMTIWPEYEDTCFVTSKTIWKKNIVSLKLMRNGVRLLSVQFTKYNTERHFTTIRSSLNQQYLPHSELRKNNTRISDFKAKLVKQSVPCPNFAACT
jgi:hypothetical protein